MSTRLETVRARHVLASMVICGLIIMNGCAKTVQELDTIESRDSLIRRAQAKAREGNKAAALRWLNMAVEKKPRLAKAPLEMAVLYDDYKNDYVRAIYHYQRYLELRPQTEKSEMIEGRIRRARMAFAESISDKISGIDKKFYELKKENMRLKNALRRVRMNLAKKISDSSRSAFSERDNADKIVK